MAAVVIEFATPALVRSGDTLTVNYANGDQNEYTGATGLQDAVSDAISNNPTLFRLFFIANRLALDPLMDSPAVWDGKKATFDPEQANPANVFKVQ